MAEKLAVKTSKKPVTTRLDPDVYEKLKAKAQAKNMKIAEYVRQLILADLSKP